jgi:hypothetical protein
MMTNVYCQDSLNLSRHYPEPKIVSIELLIGPSLVGVEKGESRVSSSVRGPNFVNYVNYEKNKLGYAVGLGLTHRIIRNFSIVTRLLGERKGFVAKFDSVSISQATHAVSVAEVWKEPVNNLYLTGSILPQLSFGKKCQLNLGVGSYGGLLVSSKTKIYQSGKFIYSFNSKPNYMKYDFGITAFAGLSYPLNTKLKFTTQFVWNYGLSPITDGFFRLSNPRWTNTTYSILIGLKIMNSYRPYQF